MPEASFSASFLVFFIVEIIVGTEVIDDNSRLFVTFKQANGGADVVIPVKKTDIGENYEMVLYDPGVGALTGRQAFMGWTDNADYTAETAGKSIEDVRSEVQELLNAGVKEGSTKVYYPIILDVYNVTLLDEEGAVLKSDPVILKSGDSKNYSIDQYYDPIYSDSKFEGWGEASQDSNGKWILPENPTLHQNGEEIKFGNGGRTDDLVLKAYVPAGYWLIYKENGEGASYTAPDFYRGAVTVAPTDPTRFGYTFGGWFTDEACTTQFTFGSVLSQTTRVYAKWNPVTTANYTVVIWTQNINADGYDFKEVVTVNNATVGGQTNVQQQGTGNNAYARINGNINKQYAGFHLKEAPVNVEVVPEGTSVVQLYYDRTAYTFTFQVQSGNSYTTIHTVTRLYDQDITDIWAFTGSDGRTYPRTDVNTSWTPVGSSTYTARITAMQRMPAENITWRHTTSNNATRYFHYYIEVPEGETGTRTFQNRQFNLYLDLPNDFNIVYYNDDFWNLKGFDRLAITKSGDQVVNLGPGNNISWTNLNRNYGGDDNHLYFYYTRQQYPINYMDGKYVDGNGVELDDRSTHPLHTSSMIDFDADISSYGEDGSNYYEPDEKDEYVFVGWYADKACVQPYEFSKMPMDGVTVYAKWVQKQYRVFLYPNADNDPTFGSGEQETSFRIDYHEEISNIKAEREEYTLSGWYRDPGFTQSFNFDAFTANDNTVTTPYDQTEPTERDQYGTVTENINKDAQNNRFWIKTKLELYAKWHYKLIGADGIVVEYDAGDGQFSDGTKQYTDPLRYQDSATAVATSAAHSTDEQKEFKCWVVQKWNGSAFVPTETKVNPGDTFEVKATDARVTENEDHTDEDPSYTYTIRLVAEYGSIEAPTPTHINWYSNLQDTFGNELTLDEFVTEVSESEEGKGWVKKDEPIEINVGYDIEPADLYSYDGYTFIGWAKKSDATEDDLFLKWVGNHFEAKNSAGEWITVTQVAADENKPYDDLYAVWQGSFYVYHSGVAGGNKETIQMNKTTLPTGKYDLTGKLTDNKLYGGYYLEGGFTKPDDNAAYNGSNWTWTKPETESGKAITPKAGETYYIKEVPSSYLNPNLYVTWDTYHNVKVTSGKTGYKLVSMFLMTVVDDANYQKVGYGVNGIKKIASETSESDKSALTETFTVTREKQAYQEHTAQSVFNLSGLLLLQEKNSYIQSNAQFQDVPYWVTPDGVKVTGATQLKGILGNAYYYKWETPGIRKTLSDVDITVK